MDLRMILDFILIKPVLILILFYQKIILKADFIASLSGCPANYQRINNGCYQIENSTTLLTRDQAVDYCNKSANDTSYPEAVGHLIAYESLAESIAMQYWFTGFSYTQDFWTDGFYNQTSMSRTWTWSGHDYSNLGYVQDTLLGSNPYFYLWLNDSRSYEFKSDTGKTPKSFICEAQVPCQRSDNQCRNNGSCYVNSGRVLCTCLPGYTGILCEILIDNCDSAPCLHGGTCNNTVNNYTCTCTEFYKGRNCDEPTVWQYQDARTVALGISTGTVCFVLALLCLMDLPWKRIIESLLPTKVQDEKAANLDKVRNELVSENTTLEDVKKHEPLKPEVLLNSEEEMLRRFKSALAQTRKTGRATPFESSKSVIDNFTIPSPSRMGLETPNEKF